MVSKQRAFTNLTSTIPWGFNDKYVDASTYKVKNPKSPHDLGYKSQESKKHPSPEKPTPTNLCAKLKKVWVPKQQMITPKTTQKLPTPKPIPSQVLSKSKMVWVPKKKSLKLHEASTSQESQPSTFSHSIQKSQILPSHMANKN